MSDIVLGQQSLKVHYSLFRRNMNISLIKLIVLLTRIHAIVANYQDSGELHFISICEIIKIMFLAKLYFVIFNHEGVCWGES